MLPFESARIRLTAWYFLISAFISITFSAIVYDVVTREILQGFRVADDRLRETNIDPDVAQMFLEEEFQLAKKSVQIRLIIINGVIIGLSGLAGYFLAGKTLQPIEEMVEEQKRFIGDASHELRTPLTTIRSETEVTLRDKKLTLLSAKAQLKSNLEETQRMQDLVAFLLTLSHYSEAKEVKKERIELNKVVTRVIAKHKKEAEKKHISLTSKVDAVSIMANETTIEQLLSILLDNALKYNTENGSVHVSVARPRRSVYVKVTDTGIGIPAKDLPHIFNRFYRADSSRSKQHIEGYGLGLAIAKSIVDIHGGEIYARSSKDKGSTFTIKFPQ
jgi:signal transduction histidine kinase